MISNEILFYNKIIMTMPNDVSAILDEYRESKILLGVIDFNALKKPTLKISNDFYGISHLFFTQILKNIDFSNTSWDSFIEKICLRDKITIKNHNDKASILSDIMFTYSGKLSHIVKIDDVGDIPKIHNELNQVIMIVLLGRFLYKRYYGKLT